MLGIAHGRSIERWERHHGPLPEAQMLSSPDGWPASVRRMVTRVTAGDFAVSADDVDASLDLLAVAVKR
jgi:hypothetical protein